MICITTVACLIIIRLSPLPLSLPLCLVTAVLRSGTVHLSVCLSLSLSLSVCLVTAVLRSGTVRLSVCLSLSLCLVTAVLRSGTVRLSVCGYAMVLSVCLSVQFEVKSPEQQLVESSFVL